jgi:Fe-S cluster biogenesis protein NfuA
MSAQPTVKDRVEQAIAAIRPFLNADGGDMRLIEIDGDVARVELVGACSNCNMSHMTMKNGVEDAIRRMAPEIRVVEAVQSHQEVQ